MQKFLKNHKYTETMIYCIGLSRHHDATFLNKLAQAGSKMGNFFYIDTNEVGYQDKMRDSIAESL